MFFNFHFVIILLIPEISQSALGIMHKNTKYLVALCDNSEKPAWDYPKVESIF